MSWQLLVCSVSISTNTRLNPLLTIKHKEQAMYRFSTLMDKKMLADDLLKEIEESDLPENFRIVADSCGMDVARALIKDWGGIKVTIPSPRSKSLRPALYRFVQKNKSKHSVATLARSLNLCESTIRGLMD